MTVTPPPAPAPRVAAGPGHQLSPTVLGPAVSETLFVPVRPCRIVDTRRGGGAMASNVARTFSVTGTAGFVGQGGTSGGCLIPVAATGVATNITTVGTASDGYLTGFPTGTPEPGTNFMTSHSSFTLTANPTLALATAAGSAKTPLTVVSHGSSTHLIIDVTGYHIPQPSRSTPTSAPVSRSSTPSAATTSMGKPMSSTAKPSRSTCGP